MKRYIGGEFWFSPDIFTLKKTAHFDEAIALFGGQSAISYIIENLKLSKDDVVLLPSYLCPTILIPFENRKVKYDFYLVDENFKIDIDFLKKKINNAVKAIYIIDYFGFFYDIETMAFLKELQNEGMKLIEDAVQGFWFENEDYFIGDYVFNSYRKVLPIDGSILLNKDNKIKDKFICNNQSYIRKMNRARLFKSIYMYLNIGSENKYLDKFENAHDIYYKNEKPCEMDRISKGMLQHVNYNKISEIRKSNYTYLYNSLKDINSLKLIFSNEFNGCVPLALPIIVENRDYLRKELMKANIFTAIHWNLDAIKDLPDFFDINREVSSKILSLPIDHRYSACDMEKIAEEIKRIMGEQ